MHLYKNELSRLDLSHFFPRERFFFFTEGGSREEYVNGWGGILACTATGPSPFLRQTIVLPCQGYPRKSQYATSPTSASAIPATISL